MNDRFEIQFPTVKRASMALAKLFAGDFGDTEVGVLGSKLVFVDRDRLRQGVEILSPPGIDHEGEWISAADHLIGVAHLKVEEAIVALDEAEDAFRCARLPGRSIMTRNAWRHLESYQSQVLEKKLGYHR